MHNKLRIMIVDDEMVIRESFFHWFKKSGHQVETAESGFEALEKLDKTFFDVLFVDVKMPGMDGITLLKEVKKTHPDTVVVVITGNPWPRALVSRDGILAIILGLYLPNFQHILADRIVTAWRRKRRRHRL